jgi:formyltetrahydrofolate deformylase
MMTTTVLLSCPDCPGLVAAVSTVILARGGNILHADQHRDPEAGIFFQRVEFQLERVDPDEIQAAFAPLIRTYGMACTVRVADHRPRLAVLVSKRAHCLYDLLGRWHLGELNADIRLIVSNHTNHRDAAEKFGVPFHRLPVNRDNKAEQEAALLELLGGESIDLIVLARYMQVLSGTVIGAYANRIINIHHSFLPAFMGARPYHRAFERGVKLVGATAHYATEDLDEGPIIDQDVLSVSHRDTVADLVRKGRDLEKTVLARAVRHHVENRVLVYGNKTVVFR